MTTALLDANALIALVIEEHEHHERARSWFADAETVAVSPVVEGALVRMLVRLGEPASSAQQALRALADHPKVQWWPDDLPYAEAPLTGVHGHRQVTDAYLAGLADRHPDAIVATFDRGFASTFPQVTLIP